MSGISAILASTDDNSPNLGIAYTSVVGTGGTLTDYQLDIYHLNERSKGNRPVVVGIHGGAFCVGDKSLSGFVKHKADFFVRKNKCVFVSLNYRLSPAGFLIGIGTALWDAGRVMFPDHYEDQATAVRWIYDNISDYGGDPNKLIFMGHSAGAQCANVLGINQEFINAVGIPTSSLKAIISVDSDGYNVLDQILNPTTDSDAGSNSDPDLGRKTYENAFGIYPGIHTGTVYRYKDFPLSTYGNSANAITAAQAQYNRASPNQHLDSTSTPKLMVIGRGDTIRITKHNQFYSDILSVGVAGTFICYPGESTTYTHEEISECIGSSQDPPVGKTLPAGIDNVSTEIIKFISSLNL